MNKDYLPFYDSLKDDDKEFWLNCTKEQLIDHIVSNIRNGEILLSRINKVREYIEENTTSYYTNTDETIEGYELVCEPSELLEILKGSDKE